MDNSRRVNLLVSVFFIIVIPIIILCLAIRSKVGLDAQKNAISLLSNGNVKMIILAPFDKGNSVIEDSVLIKDKYVINSLIKAYKEMRPQQSGDGKLTGNWQVKLIFVLNNNKNVNSYIFHTDFSDLVFISTDTMLEYHGLSDFLSSKDVSTIILNNIKSSR